MPSCPECERLRKRIAELERRLRDLERRLADAARAGKRQAAPFSKGMPKANPKKTGRKPGEQHGPHAHRPPPPPETLQETLESPLPDACPHCGGHIDEDAEIDEQFQTDIPVQPIRRKFRIHKGTCRLCKRRVRGRHPLQTSDAVGAAASQIGPNAQAAVVYLNKRSGMSYGKISDYFQQAHGIDVKPSTATRIVLRAGERAESAYEEIKESVARSEIVIPDETGWRIGGRPAWLHVAVGDEATCYFIDRRRSANALEKVIGRDYSGILGHDGYATYDRFEEALHQQCVAHAMRRAHKLAETQTGRAQEFPLRVLELFKSSLEVRDEFLAGRIGRADLEEAHVEHLMVLRELTERSRANRRNETFARHLHNHLDDWFTFLIHPTCPATNFRAEQALRLPIVNRKVFGGNRTAAGSTAQAAICSVIRTCGQQKRSAFAYILDTLRGVAGSILAAAGQASSLFSPPSPRPAVLG